MSIRKVNTANIRPRMKASIGNTEPATGNYCSDRTHYWHGKDPGPGLRGPTPAEPKFRASTQWERERHVVWCARRKRAYTHPSICLLDPSLSSGQFGSLRINFSLTRPHPQQLLFHQMSSIILFPTFHGTHLYVSFSYHDNITIVVHWSSVIRDLLKRRGTTSKTR